MPDIAEQIAPDPLLSVEDLKVHFAIRAGSSSGRSVR